MRAILVPLVLLGATVAEGCRHNVRGDVSSVAGGASGVAEKTEETRRYTLDMAPSRPAEGRRYALTQFMAASCHEEIEMTECEPVRDLAGAETTAMCLRKQGVSGGCRVALRKWFTMAHRQKIILRPEVIPGEVQDAKHAAMMFTWDSDETLNAEEPLVEEPLLDDVFLHNPRNIQHLTPRRGTKRATFGSGGNAAVLSHRKGRQDMDELRERESHGLARPHHLGPRGDAPRADINIPEGDGSNENGDFGPSSDAPHPELEPHRRGRHGHGPHGPPPHGSHGPPPHGSHGPPPYAPPGQPGPPPSGPPGKRGPPDHGPHEHGHRHGHSPHGPPGRHHDGRTGGGPPGQGSEGRRPRTSFGVLMEWLTGSDSSDSSDSSSDSSESSDSESDSSSSDDNAQGGGRGRPGRSAPPPKHGPRGAMPMKRWDDFPTSDDAVLTDMNVDVSSGFDSAHFPMDTFSHHGGFHEGFHEGSQHDHMRFRNRLPDEYEEMWFEDMDDEGCDFVEAVLAMFFFIGAFTLLALPVILFARTLKRMVRRGRSARYSAAPRAAPDGYQAMPEEKDSMDEDAIVVTGTPVNPPPSVNV